jgi:hypothetical protein
MTSKHHDASVRRENTVTALCSVSGIACLLISGIHLLFGTARIVAGAEDANATVDSLDRFFAAIFGGYGLAWLRAGRRRPVPATDIRILSGVMAVGGAGRVISLVQRGRPHWFQLVLGAVELLVPAMFIALLRDSAPAGQALP